VAQAVPYAVPAPDEGWRITIYPVLAWVPSGINIDLSLPPSGGDAGFAGEIIESRFDGAFLGGFSAAKGAWRIDADGLWAAFGGDRLETPVFTVDADVYSREIGPLAGFYPAVYAGAPWWFLDSPAEIRHFQESVTEIAGFSRLSGFIDDTRAFCSIPARHDMSRRLDAGFLAGLVAAHRLDEDEAHDTITKLVTDQPRKVFKL